MSDQSTPDAKPKRGILKILLFVVGGLVLVGIGLGAGFFLFGQNTTPSEEIDMIIERKLQEAGQLPPPEDAEGEEDAGPTRMAKPVEGTETFITSYYEFPGNFTTNLRGSRKFLQVAIGVSTQYDETVIRNVETHQLALRSEVLGVISEFTEEDVQGKEGRDAIAARMRDAINVRLEQLEGFGGIEGVHFTSFILQ
ncbi:flagellar biosynthesis protein FliL [Rhodobacterales bacterium LSUCC0031]|nr:flagellar biosynthesis protein FliL [Rhodobacterales bacterium LSUCC0031]